MREPQRKCQEVGTYVVLTKKTSDNGCLPPQPRHLEQEGFVLLRSPGLPKLETGQCVSSSMVGGSAKRLLTQPNSCKMS